ncbi:MAG: hypothetical protein LC118_15310 [Dehalococcoidia bacterium]|nr:hypothetical protein [Dehalococcoidia bacterium]
MALANWSDVEALVKPWFDGGEAPDREALVNYAFEQDASDDVIDALDSLGPRPIPSLEALKEQLQKNNALAE